MTVAAWFLSFYGPRAAYAPQVAQSKEEEAVYAALDRLIGRESYIAHWHPFGGDIPFTPGRESREVDVYIPALDVAIFVNSAFTHSDPQADQRTAELMRLIGVEPHFIWDYQILPERGGDAYANLVKLVPSLKFFGAVIRRQPNPSKQKKTFRQPPRVLPFPKFGEFKIGQAGF